MKIEKVAVTFQTSEADKSEATFELVELVVSEGSTVQAGEILAVAETDKAAIEIESPVSGKIKKVFLKTGQTYRHGEILCEIEVQ